ncbi:MAG: signal peptidase I, partial [Actinomycetota bacterium]|nr:signal peptidase I [Actinomycetota bacterium]
MTGSADAADTTDEHAEAGESSDVEPDTEPPKKKRGALREAAVLLSIALVLYYVMLTFVARPYL